MQCWSPGSDTAAAFFKLHVSTPFLCLNDPHGTHAQVFISSFCKIGHNKIQHYFFGLTFHRDGKVCSHCVLLMGLEDWGKADSSLPMNLFPRWRFETLDLRGCKKSYSLLLFPKIHYASIGHTPSQTIKQRSVYIRHRQNWSVCMNYKDLHTVGLSENGQRMAQVMEQKFSFLFCLRNHKCYGQV